LRITPTPTTPDENSNLPDRSVENQSLKELSIRSGFVTLSSQAVSYGIHAVSLVVLARLLTPEDYGVIAMVAAVTGFVNLFRELGLSSAAVQKNNLTDQQSGALFWISAGLGATATLIIAALAPAVAWFYQRAELSTVTLGLSLTSLVSSLGTQHGVLLTRQMRFKALAVTQISAMLAGLVTAVAVALSGGQYWALVASAWATVAWHTTGLWVVSGFRPGWPKRGTQIRQLLRFGASITAFDLTNYFHRNLDHVLIGRVWGAQQLGLYSRAYAMLTLPLSNLRGPLDRVALPAMSRLQNDPERFRSYYVKYCSRLAFLSMPLVSFFFLFSDCIVRLLLGNRWMGSADLFGILALVAFIQPTAGLRGLVLLATGQGKRYFRLGLYIAILTSIAFICGLPWGAKGVAIGYCIVTYATLHPSLAYAFRHTSVRSQDFYQAISRPFLASMSLAVGGLWLRSALPPLPDYVLLTLSVPAYALLYLLVIAALPQGGESLRSYWSDLRLSMGKRG
jgi:polysaccharide transporter, PST family